MSLILGRIIVSKNLLNHEVIQRLIKKPTLLITDNLLFNDNIPTLYIGWDIVRKIYDEDITILNKKIYKDKNIYWTFSPNELLQDFNEDIDYFISKLYDDLIKDIQYKSIDPVIDQITKSENLLRYSYDNYYDCSYITDDYIYLYEHIENIIVGVDLQYFKTLKYNIDKLIDSIKSFSKVIIIEDYTTDGIYLTYRGYFNKDFDKKYIPYINYKMN